MHFSLGSSTSSSSSSFFFPPTDQIPHDAGGHLRERPVRGDDTRPAGCPVLVVVARALLRRPQRLAQLVARVVVAKVTRVVQAHNVHRLGVPVVLFSKRNESGKREFKRRNEKKEKRREK